MHCPTKFQRCVKLFHIDLLTWFATLPHKAAIASKLDVLACSFAFSATVHDKTEKIPKVTAAASAVT